MRQRNDHAAGPIGRLWTDRRGGVLYFPTGELTFAGGSTADPTHTMIVADMVKFAGNTEFAAPENSTA